MNHPDIVWELGLLRRGDRKGRWGEEEDVDGWSHLGKGESGKLKARRLVRKEEDRRKIGIEI